MTTAYGERINIQKKHHGYRKKTTKNTRNGYKLMTVKKTTSYDMHSILNRVRLHVREANQRGTDPVKP